MHTTDNTIIDVSKLSFAYEKDNVLKNINFSIQEKEFLSIIGPNGGGKSTLLKLILGIEKIQEGKILIAGKQHDKQVGTMGYVPQNTNINVNFPIQVIEVVMMGQNRLQERMFGYSKEEKIQAYEVLHKVGMSAFASKRISSLSGGQRQRVLIARALFSNPKILLLDEPTSSVDTKSSKEIYTLLKTLNKELTIVVVTHDISVVIAHATRAFYINKELVNHDLAQIKEGFLNNNAHICEIELLEMLGRGRC